MYCIYTLSLDLYSSITICTHIKYNCRINVDVYGILQVDTLFSAMNNVTVDDKPPSIFQCQLKLFNQWYPEWSSEHRKSLYDHLTQADAAFMIKLNETIFLQSTSLS